MIFFINTIIKKFPNFFSASNGNVGIIFALAVTPIFATVGAAIDYGYAVHTRSALQVAVDTAALAGAQGTHLTKEERIEIAENSFAANFKENNRFARPNPNVSVDTNGRVSVEASLDVRTSFLRVVQIDDFQVSSRASAVAVNPQPICLLALNETMDKAIEIGGTGTLEAINCAVQANSTSPIAIYAGGSSTAKAAAFCTPGGYSGYNFDPTPKTCYPVEDPYKDMELPYAGSCNHNNKRIKKQNGYVTLSPGTYCGGIDIGVHAQVHMLPGVYKIKGGDFSVSSHANVSGQGVTIYLTGNNTSIDVDGGASVDLQAPTSGDYEGFLFVQDADSNPGAINTINGGGSIKLVGTLYFPTQAVHINGNGMLGINSPMMPIIADHFVVNGNGIFQVDVDEANMDIEIPMTNDGAVVMN